MILEKFKTPGLAQIGYLIGRGGVAAVVDPRRDVDLYLDAAARHRLAIRHVVETHRQEDYVVGSSQLSAATGASVVNGTHELFGRGDVRLADRQTHAFGGLVLQALHTPGHTPEGVCYALSLEETPDVVLAVFTGDTLFVGETGRTDLPDPLQTGRNAGVLYDVIREKILPLGDQAIILPAHGSGSVCGGRIADRDESTLGAERRSNPVFLLSREAFIARKLEERIPRPFYFRRMEHTNLRGGTAPPSRWNQVPLLDPAAFKARMDSAIVIDTRTPEAFASGHIPGSYSIVLKMLSVFAGWIHDGQQPVLLVLRDIADLREAVEALQRVGSDTVIGVLAGGFEAWRDAGFDLAQAPALTPAELAGHGAMRVLDVRDDAEFEEGHHPRASHLYVGYIATELERVVPPIGDGEEIAVTCSVGNRASLAVSILLRLGRPRARNLLGGMNAWKGRGGALSGGNNRTTTPDIEGERG